MVALKLASGRAHPVLQAAPVGRGFQVTPDIRTDVIMTGELEEFLQMNPVHDRDGHIGLGEIQKAGEEAVEAVLGIAANPFGFLVAEHGRPCVAGADDPAIRQFGIVGASRQAADEADGAERGAVRTNLELLRGDLVFGCENPGAK